MSFMGFVAGEALASWWMTTRDQPTTEALPRRQSGEGSAHAHLDELLNGALHLS
jgi:hypothetical protein